MQRVGYTIGGGLTPEQLDAFHRTVLRVMAEVGVEVGSPELLAGAKEDPGASVTGTRVRLEPDLVQGHVDEYRARHAGAGDAGADFSIDVLTGFAFQVLDPATDELRPMTTDECVRSAMLVDRLHDRGVRGGTPGLPQDVPPQLREILAYRIGCEHSRTAAHVGVTSDRAAEIVYEMSQVVGMRFALPVFVLSPLRIDGQSIGMALTFLRRELGVDVTLTGMPLMGLTAPLSPAGAFVEHVATVLTAYVLFQLIGMGDALTCHFAVYPFDMKYGTIAYGTPRHVLAHLIGTQINRYYGAPTTMCKAFHTNAIFPDAHSIAQRASFAAVAALDGARNFTFGGMLGIDKVFSAEQLLIDVESVDYVRHLVEGLRFDESSLGLGALRDVGPGGDFLTHDTTLESYRELWVSDLFENRSPEQWAAGDRLRVKDRIRERLAELEARDGFRLDAAAAGELERIYRAAERELT